MSYRSGFMTPTSMMMRSGIASPTFIPPPQAGNRSGQATPSFAMQPPPQQMNVAGAPGYLRPVGSFENVAASPMAAAAPSAGVYSQPRGMPPGRAVPMNQQGRTYPSSPPIFSSDSTDSTTPSRPPARGAATFVPRMTAPTTSQQSNRLQQSFPDQFESSYSAGMRNITESDI